MMLYEAVHYQRSEQYFDYSQKMKENTQPKERPRVQRTRSSNNMPRFVTPPPMARTASFVIGQKLRESKWFTHAELCVFCAVVETGFIVQRKDEKEEIEYGIAVWNVGEEKSKNPEHVKIYSLYPHKDNFKVTSYDLSDFWPEGTRLRIFNQSDKTETPHTEDIIRDQLNYAESTKQRWHSTEHFTYWCRYGPVQINHRFRNMTDAKWGNFGLNAGLLLLKKRIRRITNSK